jgi:NMD protein affecting ribosome stability and mRNA decay
MSDVSHETNRFTSNIAAQIEQRARGIRKQIRHGGQLCSHCLEKPPAGPNDRYCRECRAADRRARRIAAKEELRRLRALEKQLLKDKDDDSEHGNG